MNLPIRNEMKKRNIREWTSNRRTTLIIIFCCILQLTCAKAFSQSSVISLNLKNVSVEQVLNAIESKTAYSFLCNKNLVDLSRKVTVRAEKQNVRQILTEIFKGTDVTFVIDGKHIVLSKTENKSTLPHSHKITGKVTDRKGNAIIGATIKVAGTNKGTFSDVNGEFSLDELTNGRLSVSSIGYATSEVIVSGKTNYNIVLDENNQTLDEVVVVGYGVQKKINLTGSVASVSSKALEARPISNSVTGLQGALPGVTIMNATSRPGDNTVSIRIRGIGTLNNSDPLILIDGIEGNLNTLNPDDIESASVLKDAASSSIYGSRAANGVILITTKKANRETKPTLNYTGYYATQMPTRKPQMLDAVQYLTLLKEATENVNKNWGYSNDDIDAVINGTNPNYLANTNWVDEMYKNSAPQQGHNLSLNGGNKTMGYYMSYGYLSTEGLMVGDGYHATRNNIRLKVNSELFDRLNIEGNIGFNDVNNWTPTTSDSPDGGLFYQALRSSPLVPVRFTDGQWGYGGSSANPVALASDGGFNNYKSQETTLDLTASMKIFNGLVAKVQYGSRITNVLSKQQTNMIEHFYPNTETHLSYSANTSSINQRDALDRYQTISAQMDYDKTIGKHSFHVLGGFSQEWQLYERMDAGREDLISNSLHVLNNGTDKQTNSGYALNWAIRSGFGRFNYNFADRYLFEANVRYDLSSRFYKDNRGGYFPSASFAWRLSEESFMQNIRKWVDNLKIRVSYGSLGNQYTSSLYPYLSTISSSTSAMPIGANITSSMQQTVASNNGLSWESIRMSNIGVDFGVFNNRLTFTGDYYIKKTKGILLKVNLPDVLGVTEPYQNAGVVRNEGWEAVLAWNDKIGKDFNYGFNFSLSDVRNKVVSVGNTANDFSGDQIRAVGYPIDGFWGYVSEGLASVDDFDYNAGTNTYTPKSTFPIINEYRTKIQPGDIKYKDLNGDGKITKAADRTYLGSPIPRYTFSFGGNAQWKSLDLQFFFQGIGKCDGYIKGLGRHAFTELANYPQKVHLDRWTWDNQNPNASYPRFTYGENYNQSNLSSFWIEDASYLRLKNLQVGYTVPKKLLEKLRIEKCRIYFSGENLFTLTDFYESYDPEVPVSSGGYYPVTKTYSLGLSVSFK